MNEKFVSRKQVELLGRRIKFAEETDASKELYAELANRQAARILIVGAGGSYPAAIFAKYAINYMYYSTIDVATPQTGINMLHQNHYDLVIGISYSGKTPDIEAVALAAALKGSFFTLITGAEKESVSDFFRSAQRTKVISYHNPLDDTGKERGMISMASTLNPCIIFDDNGARKLIHENQMALLNAQSFVKNLDINQIASNIERWPVIHVFYEWDTYATAADIESKFTESGIANVILHEKKNFSHGRYIALYKQPFALIINLTRYSIHHTYRTDYDRLLAEFLRNLPLCTTKYAYYLELGTAVAGELQWNIENMAKLPYLITAIGEALGVDISKPLVPFPEAPTKLYNYRGKF